MVLARKGVSIGYINGKPVFINDAIEDAAKVMSVTDPQANADSKLLDGFLALTDSAIKLIESAGTRISQLDKGMLYIITTT